MIQKSIRVGALACNCQILVCPKTFEAVIIDAGDESEKILAELSQLEQSLGQKIKLKALLHTHGHFDHVSATRKIVEHCESLGNAVPLIYLHAGDREMYERLPEQAALFGFKSEAARKIDRFFEDEQELKFGELKLSVLHTPGHSPGGVCLRLHENKAMQVSETVFTGDTLFKNSIGRSDLWGGSSRVLIESIQRRLLTLDDDTLAWPGHGDQTKIGQEKRSNPYLT